MLRKTIAVLPLSLVLAAGSASATLIAYTDRADWEAAVGGAFTTEDFSSFAGTTSYETTPLDVGDFTVSVSGETFGSSWHNVSATGSGGSSVNSVNGTQQLNFATGSTGGTTLAFDFAITAFGGDWAGVSDGRTTSIFADGFSLAIPARSGDFFGFVSDAPFSSIFLALTAGAADGFGLDNVVYTGADAVSVPEPSVLALLALGLLGLGLSRRKLA